MSATLIKTREVCNHFTLPDSYPDFLKNIYRRRNIDSAEQLNLGLVNLLPPSGLKGMSDAVDLLMHHLLEQQAILIVADFDADGATSCALAIRCLRAFGHDRISYLVPNRFEFGYGLTPEIVELAQQQNPALIITVDNGISSVEGVRAAKNAGIDVLVTDHHLAGAQLPAADAIVNPNQPGCEFSSKAIAGVGVIFYVMSALRAELKNIAWFDEKGLDVPNMANYLDLVALGTVADVVALDYNNRILVAEGIRRIKGGRGCAGINALLRIANRDARKLVAADMGFAVGPRLNAAGRLDDMSLGIECLLTDDQAVAQNKARELDGLNRDRRQIETGMKEQALQDLADELPSLENIPTGICLYNETWHQGVVGIVASRVKELHHRPTIVFANAAALDSGKDVAKKADAVELKGSARSIPGLHIRDVLDQVATENPGLISKFGGHAMAAGLSLTLDSYALFAREFDRVCAEHLNEQQLQANIWVDGELPTQLISAQTVSLLNDAGPWGQAFPEPLFVGNFKVLKQRVLTERHIKFELQLRGYPGILPAIAFNVDDEFLSTEFDDVTLVYRLQLSDFRGRSELQLMIEHISLEPHS